MSTVLVQVLLIVVLFAANAFDVALRWEWIVFALAVAGAVAAVVLLASGTLTR